MCVTIEAGAAHVTVRVIENAGETVTIPGWELDEMKARIASLEMQVLEIPKLRQIIEEQRAFILQLRDELVEAKKIRK